MNRRPRGQALAEFALVFPIAIMVIFGILVIGLWVFYQQQLTNVAREGARFAAIHSSTAPCPTSSWRDPPATPWVYPFHCDGPNNPGDSYPWPKMAAHARSFAWGLNANAVHINACWSGYRPYGTSPTTNADFPPMDTSVSPAAPNVFHQCTIDGRDPVTNPQDLACRARMTTSADDHASNVPSNQVTLYACFDWRPPLAGFLLIPAQVTMKAVITEVIHHQQ